ncbi:hypothetical protein C0J52_12407 [Blattella germanica]|nr:hypothetical protein C0J52_12407 [Blattella germanica]
MGHRVLKALINSLNPYRFIACYAIFFVVHAEGTVKHSVRPTGVEGPIEELLGSIISGGGGGGGAGAEEESLVRSLSCDSGTCEDILHHGNINDAAPSNSQLTLEIPLPNVITEHIVTHDDQRSSQQQFSTSSQTQDKTAPSRMKPFRDVFTDLPVLAPTSSRITNEICRKHSRIFVHQLKRYKLWALQMYDSSAKLPSGILKGNVNQFGDFDQCLAIETDESSNIEGKYCLASVDIDATSLIDNDTETLHKAVYLAKSYEFIKSTYRDPGQFAPRFTTINWAVCVPASCSPEDVQQSLVDALQDYNETIGVSFDVHVDPEMCYTKSDAEKSFSIPTLCTLIFFAVVICIAVAATFIDRNPKISDASEQGQMKRLVMAFSIKKNIDELTADLPAEGDINCIHGIRAIFTAALYLAHKVIMLCLSPYTNRVSLTEVSNEWWSTIFRTSIIYTDSFLMMSGILTSFNLSKEIERKKHIDWFNKYIARFIRLTPALLALVLFYAYVMEHLGTGPQWNLSVKRNADLCKDSFWKNILYIQTFFPFEQMCATHTHHLALDMQLSLLSPLLVTLLWQWRVFGMMVLLSLYTLSAALRYLTTLQNQLSIIIFHGISVKQLYQAANLTYGKSLHRATPYLVGVALGHIMHKTGKKVDIPKFAVVAGWLLSSYFIYLSMISPFHLGFRDYEYDVQQASLYVTFSPIIWSLALGWIIWACFTGHGGFVNKFLCCRSLVLFSRISYAVYLTQFAVFFYNIGSVRAPQHFSLARSVDLFEVITVIVVSIFVTLLFDLPMQEIKSIIMGSGK